MFFAKYINNSLFAHWIISGSKSEVGKSMDELSNGDFMITGEFDDQFFYGDVFTTLGGKDVMIARADSNGDCIWSKTYGSTGSDVVQAVHLTQDESLIILLYAPGSINFGAISTSKNFLRIFFSFYRCYLCSGQA
jgi:hypothetical protein